MAKATKTIKQPLSYKSAHSSYFATTKTLFNQVAAFYFEVIVAHTVLLELSSKGALPALETLTHTTKNNPHPVMPLACAITADIPAMFRRAAIHAALGSARSFTTHLEKWRNQKEKAQARGKKFTSASTSVEQISHTLCRTMERAHAKQHHAQALDRKLLGLDQMRHPKP